MDLLKEILQCKEEDVDSIVEKAIAESVAKGQKIGKLGFLNTTESNSVFEGFIPLDTRIKYATMNMEDYSMQTTDFFYEFAHFIRKYNIDKTVSLIHYLEYFINNYFGYPGKENRENVFNDYAWQTTSTDEEYFKALENNKIGDLKGKGAAECTERGALAQQILSLFGYEVYYCMGCLDREDTQEAHCFNIIKRKNDYALLDYSIPVPAYDENGILKNYYPFIGELTNLEFLEFIDSGIIKSFDDYSIENKQKKYNNQKRMYIVGKYTIEKENEITSSK